MRHKAETCLSHENSYFCNENYEKTGICDKIFSLIIQHDMVQIFRIMKQSKQTTFCGDKCCGILNTFKLEMKSVPKKRPTYPERGY